MKITAFQLAKYAVVPLSFNGGESFLFGGGGAFSGSTISGIIRSNEALKICKLVLTNL